jgi:nucleoside-diphosphate-sugar epimerase
MEKIVIVGVNGFTGNKLLDALISSHRIIGVGRENRLPSRENYRFVKFDEVKKEDIIGSYIIFCHNYTKNTYDETIFNESTATVSNILNVAFSSGGGPKGVIYFSSLAIYRGYIGGQISDSSPPIFDQSDWYARVKIKEEEIIKNFSKTCKLTFLILRSSAIIGDGFHSNLIFNIFNTLKNNSNLLIDNRHIEFNVLVGISSIIKIVNNFISGENNLNNKTFILSSSDSNSLEIIVYKIKKILNSKSEIIWGTSILRGPHYVVQENNDFREKYLRTINEILKEI